MANGLEKFKSRALHLRKAQTSAEARLWQALRNRRLAHWKFRRQHAIGPYIVDFYCAALALAVEIDGETHLGKEVHDKVRQDWLERQGLKVARFWNTQIYEEQEAVFEALWRECEMRRAWLEATHPSPPTPLP